MDRKIDQLSALIALFMGCALLLSYNLWLSDRFYPLIPFIKDWPIQIPPPIDLGVFALLMGLLIAIIVAPNKRPFIWSLLGLSLLLILNDQSRLQPYTYQYLVMFFCIVTVRNTQWAAYCLQIIVVGLYLWAGIQKINPTFLDSVFPFMIHKVVSIPDDWATSSLRYIGLIVPLCEIAIALLLIFGKTRKGGVWLVAALHIGVLILLGPWLNNWGQVVWPWNLAMILITYTLFWDAPQWNRDSFRQLVRLPAFYMATVLFMIMPGFFHLGLWDHHLSMNMYSGRTTYASIRVDEQLAKELPEEIKVYMAEFDDGSGDVLITNWSKGEMKVVHYPEERVYTAIRDYLCSFSEEEDCTAEVIIYTR